MSNNIHVYQLRHIFSGDNYVGKIDMASGTLNLLEAHQAEQDRVRLYFSEVMGMHARVEVNDEKVHDSTPPGEFPDEIRAQMTPQAGDLTPVAVSYARKHWTPRQFNKRYADRVDDLLPEDEDQAPETPPQPPAMKVWRINACYLVAAPDRDTAVKVWDEAVADHLTGPHPLGLASAEEGFTITEEVYDFTLPAEQLPPHAVQVTNYVKGITIPVLIGKIQDDEGDDDEEEEETEPEGDQAGASGDTGGNTTAPPVLNKLGLPEGAPDNYNDLKKFLQDRGVTIPANIKKEPLIELYQAKMTEWNGTPPAVIAENV